MSGYAEWRKRQPASQVNSRPLAMILVDMRMTQNKARIDALYAEAFAACANEELAVLRQMDDRIIIAELAYSILEEIGSMWLRCRILAGHH